MAPRTLRDPGSAYLPLALRRANAVVAPQLHSLALDSSSDAAFLCTIATRLSAALAMLDLMPRALFGTSVADFGAELGNLLCKNGAPRHFLSGQFAHIRTASSKPNTLHHHLDVLFVEASGGATFAFSSANFACFDACFVTFVGHFK